MHKKVYDSITRSNKKAILKFTLKMITPYMLLINFGSYNSLLLFFEIANALARKTSVTN